MRNRRLWADSTAWTVHEVAIRQEVQIVESKILGNLLCFTEIDFAVCHFDRVSYHATCTDNDQHWRIGHRDIRAFASSAQSDAV